MSRTSSTAQALEDAIAAAVAAGAVDMPDDAEFAGFQASFVTGVPMVLHFSNNAARKPKAKVGVDSPSTAVSRLLNTRMLGNAS